MNQMTSFPFNLRQVAILGLSQSGATRSIWQDLSGSGHWHHISALARCASDNPKLDSSQVLPTFFTKEAVEILMSLPNSFWFWNVIWYAAGYPTHTGLIDKVILDRVFAQLRQRLAAVYDLEMAIEQMSAIDLAIRVAEGVLVFKSESWQHLNGAPLVYNVIFQPRGSAA